MKKSALLFLIAKEAFICNRFNISFSIINLPSYFFNVKQKIFFSLLLLGFSISGINAQNYKLNKQTYDYRMYLPQPGDPYNPTTMGIASFFVPGLGQILCNETGRGLAFLGSSALLTGATIVGALMSYEETTYYNNFGDPITEIETNPTGIAILLVGAAATLAIDIWAIIDATKVAKVNNMYLQDLRKNTSQIKLDLTPFVDTYNYLGQNNLSGGLSLKVTF